MLGIKNGRQPQLDNTVGRIRSGLAGRRQARGRTHASIVDTKAATTVCGYQVLASVDYGLSP